MGFKSRSFGALVAVLLAYYFFKSEVPKSPSPIIKTHNGQVEGVMSLSRDGRSFFAYYGIPYAKPPVGELRYEFPQEHENWVGVRTADKYGSECSQFNAFAKTFGGSEDCLFLNIFTPKLNTAKNEPMPVMVFIHGGLFVFGSTNMYGPEYFMEHDVVLVTLNYRLSSFGFLSTGDGVVRGNMGLRDQALALKWVQRNIQHFGGDPKHVTIFGESAGSASVHLQALSPTTKGLFQRAILQSGSALSPWVIKANPAEQAKRHAARLNCSRKTTKEMVECMKKVSAAAILEAHSDAREVFKDPITLFSPTVESVKDDDTFLPEHPLQLIRSGKTHKIPLMIGYNSHEGLLSAPEIVGNQTTLNTFQTQFLKVMPNYIFYPKRDPKILADEMQQIRDFYFGKNERIDVEEKFHSYTNLFTDYLFAVGVQETLKIYTEHSPSVHAYYYAYKGEFQLSSILLALKGNYPPIVELLIHAFKKLVNKYVFGQEPVHHGTCHGDELAILFKIPKMSDITPTHKDYDLSKHVVKLWVSFASEEKTMKFKDQVWLPLKSNAKSLKFLNIDEVTGIIENPNDERIQFWKNIYY